ncbi:MAG: rhodanese-like domain-containing protein [Actinomycetota bacterium]|nr:rhodanese-like domain-containing protein [Actinomycetota bacterium]
MRILIEPEDLGRLEQPVCLVDARAEVDYDAGHVPGALHLDTFEFSNEQTEGEQLDSVLAEWHEMFLEAGIPADETVVFYDAGTENRGSRPALMMRALGHERSHVLHGGMTRWIEDGGAVSTVPERRERESWERRPGTTAVVGLDAVRSVLDSPDVVLLDVRSEGEYTGEMSMQGNPRLGHLPRARHLDWRSLIEHRSEWPAGAGTPRDGDQLLYRLLPPDQLWDRLAAVGVGPRSEVMIYCQKSHRASVVYVALETLGVHTACVYAGSFREWSRRPDAPIEG